jgi:hypothetical protein
MPFEFILHDPFFTTLQIYSIHGYFEPIITR